MTDPREEMPEPTDFEGQAQIEKKQAQYERAVAIRRAKDLAWLLAGERGRRKVRFELGLAGFNMNDELVLSIFDRHYGAMCAAEGPRISAVQQIWSIMRLLAKGEIPFADFKALMLETDQ